MKKNIVVSSLLLLLVSVISFSASGMYGNMYRGKYYNTTYFTEIGQGAFASMKNLDEYDDGIGDVYMQNYIDAHGNWITQCSAQNQWVRKGTQIGCKVTAALSYDGRSRGIYDSIPTGGSYIYSHLW